MFFISICRQEYSLEELKQKPPPEGVDPSRLETYLSADDFQVRKKRFRYGIVRSFVRSFPRSFVTLSFRFLVLPGFLCNFSFRFLVLSFIFPSSLCHFTLSSSYHCIFPSPIRLFFLSPVVCLQSGRVQSVRHSVTLSFRVFSSSSLRPSFRR